MAGVTMPLASPFSSKAWDDVIDIQLKRRLQRVRGCAADTSLQKRGTGGGDSVAAERAEGVITMTTTGAQYALATSSGAGGGGGGAGVGVDSKSGIVVVTTSSSSASGSAAQTQSTRGQQLITVVTSPDPSSPNSLQVQPIQVGHYF